MVKWWSSKSFMGVRFPPPLLFLKYVHILRLLSVATLAGFYLLWVTPLWGFSLFPNNIVYLTIIGFTLFWVVSIFVFLYKRGQYSIFVSSLQRFWKRTLYLFWLIELYLFGTYLFLVLISPNETYYLLDHKVLFSPHDLVSYEWVYSMRYFIYLFVLITLTILLNTYPLFTNTIMVAIVCLLGIVMSDEVVQCAYLLSNLNGDFFVHRLEAELKDEEIFLNKDQILEKLKKWKGPKNRAYEILLQQSKEKTYDHDFYADIWEHDEDKLRYRTVNFYSILIAILKVWHLGFIFVTFVMSAKFISTSFKKSTNVLSGNLQNFYFLFAFFFLALLLGFKYYMQWSYFTPYFFFFLNYNTWEFLITLVYSLVWYF